jgi:hypothetical protein
MSDRYLRVDPFNELSPQISALRTARARFRTAQTYENMFVYAPPHRERDRHYLQNPPAFRSFQVALI